MDNDILIDEIANVLGIETKEAQKNLQIISECISGFCCECDSVSIPGFGTFIPVKNDDSVSIDNSGKRILNPPSITVEFKPSIILRNKC